MRAQARYPAARRARIVHGRRPPKTRGRSAIPRGTQGRPGARCTRGLACHDAHSKSAHEHTGSAEAARPSLRNGFTAYFVLSPARPGFVVTVAPKKKLASQELDTSHWGVRTTRLRRPLHALFVKSASASAAPRPNVSDDGQRPLSRDGMAKNKQVIWV
jgi:hypothetical protein